MSDIINKVQMYLNQVSKEPVKISDKLVEEFGEACKNALRRQFSEKRKDKFEPRMSNIGRPLCQLQMEAKGIKGDGQPYNNKMRNTFGDLVEALAIFVLKSAGVKIDSEQKKLSISLKKTLCLEDWMLKLITKFGTLRVRHHIPLNISLEKRGASMK